MNDNIMMCNFDEDMEEIINKKNDEIERSKQIVNNALFKFIIDKNNLALKLFQNNMYHYKNYDHYGNSDVEISNLYGKYFYDDEIVEFIKNKILAKNRKMSLFQNQNQSQNIIQNLDNKFIVIYFPCFFPYIDEYNINMDFIIQYKYDIIRFCFENINAYMGCFSINQENKIEFERDFSSPYFQYEKNIKYLKKDHKYIMDEYSYYMFTMRDFYDAISVY